MAEVEDDGSKPCQGCGGHLVSGTCLSCRTDLGLDRYATALGFPVEDEAPNARLLATNLGLEAVKMLYQHLSDRCRFIGITGPSPEYDESLLIHAATIGGIVARTYPQVGTDVLPVMQTPLTSRLTRIRMRHALDIFPTRKVALRRFPELSGVAKTALPGGLDVLRRSLAAAWSPSAGPTEEELADDLLDLSRIVLTQLAVSKFGPGRQRLT